MHASILAPSILAGDHANLAASAQIVESVGVSWIHLDIMDGHFVPNLTFGPQTVAALRASGADQLTAWLGPAIGPQAFEVGSEVREAFAHLGPEAEAAFVPVSGEAGKFFADLAGLARLALLRAGVTQVSGGEDCTVSNPTKFYSFRRDQITGRMASMIWIK